MYKGAFVLVTSKTDPGRVLFLNRRDPVIDHTGRELYPAGVLDLPGGTITPHNGDLGVVKQEAIRELGEETGMQRTPEELNPVAVFRSVDGNELVYFSLQLDEWPADIQLQDSEHIGFAYVDVHDFPSLIEVNMILDVHADMAMVVAREGEEVLDHRSDINPVVSVRPRNLAPADSTKDIDQYDHYFMEYQRNQPAQS